MHFFKKNLTFSRVEIFETRKAPKTACHHSNFKVSLAIFTIHDFRENFYCGLVDRLMAYLEKNFELKRTLSAEVMAQILISVKW